MHKMNQAFMPGVTYFSFCHYLQDYNQSAGSPDYSLKKRKLVITIPPVP